MVARGRFDGRALEGVSTTTLWTLRNRAEEALRPGSVFVDPLAVELYRAVDFDYESFGRPSRLHAMRALAFDHVVADYLETHPHATVVALAEGLQTSYWRLGRTPGRWISLDLPPVIELRERLLPREPAVEYRAVSALDLVWADDIDVGKGIVVTAEGLFMYLEPAAVGALIGELAQRFPGGLLVFDSIPRWFRDKTLKGLRLPGGYVTPPMPYAQSVTDARRFRDVPGVAEVTDIGLPSEFASVGRRVALAVANLPVLRDQRPSITVLRFAPS